VGQKPEESPFDSSGFLISERRRLFGRSAHQAILFSVVVAGHNAVGSPICVRELIIGAGHSRDLQKDGSKSITTVSKTTQ
jgi:hypothetical protein